MTDLSSRGRPRRSRLAAVLVGIVACFSMTVVVAAPSQAFVPPVVAVMAPIIGSAGLTLGVTAVGVGAWYAWSNRDTIRSWLDDRSGIGVKGESLNANGSPFGWVGHPNAVYDVANNVATWTVSNSQNSEYPAIFSGRCYNPSTGDVGPLTTQARGLIQPKSERAFDITFCSTPFVVVSVIVQAFSENAPVSLTWAVQVPSVTREQRVTVTCRNNLGSTATFVGAGVSATVVPVDGGTPRSALVPSCADLMPDSHQDVVKVEDRYPNGSWETVQLQTAGAPAAGDPYADCTMYSGATGCGLSVWLNGKACSTDITACWSWLPDSAFTSGFECHWGPYVLPLSNCNPLRWQYDPNQSPATTDEPGIATRPSTGQPGTGATPAPGAQPLPTTGSNTDPRTGQPYPRPSSDPSASPGTVPSLGPGPAPAPGDETGANCMGAAWSWNPVNWVYIPAKCALSWAFIPDQAKVDRVTGLGSELTGKVPFGYIAQIQGTASGAAAAAGGGDCWRGVNVSVNGFQQRVPNLCDGELHDALTPLRPWLTAAMWFGLAVPLGMWMFRRSVPVIGGGQG